MKPGVAAVVANAAHHLRDDIAPQLTGFRAGNASMIAAMLDMVSEEWDRAAARLVSENAELRQVLAQGSAYLSGPAEDLAPDTDLRISALEAENDRLRDRLIELQTAVETRDDAGTLNDAIWNLLRRSVETRRIASANF